MSRAPRIGILAVQGDVREHAATLSGLGADVIEVRTPEELSDVDGLVIPGGESTAIGRLIGLSGLEEPLRRYDRPILGTCAGMILLAKEAEDGVAGQPLLGRIDLVVRRNGYGRQLASFEADLELSGEPEPLHGIFIRAPRVIEHGPEVEVLAELDGDPVLVREGAILAAAFHPELTGDTRVHERFLALVKEEAHVGA
jgi:5'-phosphate synthase pdxT subunit